MVTEYSSLVENPTSCNKGNGKSFFVAFFLQIKKREKKYKRHMQRKRSTQEKHEDPEHTDYLSVNCRCHLTDQQNSCVSSDVETREKQSHITLIMLKLRVPKSG